MNTNSNLNSGVKGPQTQMRGQSYNHNQPPKPIPRVRDQVVPTYNPHPPPQVGSKRPLTQYVENPNSNSVRHGAAHHPVLQTFNNQEPFGCSQTTNPSVTYRAPPTQLLTENDQAAKIPLPPPKPEKVVEPTSHVSPPPPPMPTNTTVSHFLKLTLHFLSSTKT